MKSSAFFAGFAILAIFLSSFCYIYGALHTVEGATYTGIRGINASDYNTHLSWIEQMRHGKFFLNNLYTSEPHRGLMVRPVYFLLTLPFRATSLSNTVVFHILRITCGLILLCFLPSLIRVFEKDPAVIKITFALLVFASGAGWILQTWIPSPADMSIPETSLFLSLGEAPHFSFSLLFLWLGIASIYTAGQEWRRSLLVYLVCLLLLWWEHPFDAVTLVVLGAVNVLRFPNRMSQILFLIGTAVVSLPPFLFFLALQKFPAFSGWGTAQGLMSSPSLPSLLCAFLPLIVFGIFGVAHLWNDRDKRKLLTFLLVWICVQSVLIYIPSSFQRRLIVGIQFPFALLAAYGLNRLRSRAVIILLILLASAGNFLIMRQQTREIRSGGMPFYLPLAYRDAFQWLDTQPRQGAVLSGFVTGNFIPAYTGLPVFVGHSLATPDSAAKKKQLAAFYRKPTLEFLSIHHLHYVFFGLEERRLSPDFANPGLRKVFENDAITIFSAGEAPGPYLTNRLNVRPRGLR